MCLVNWKKNKVVYYRGKKIEIVHPVVMGYNECQIWVDEYESFIEYEYYPDNGEFHISKLKVHELCRNERIGCELICAAIQRVENSICKVTVTACAESEYINEFSSEKGYVKPRTQVELVEYYRLFSYKENGKLIKFVIS